VPDDRYNVLIDLNVRINIAGHEASNDFKTFVATPSALENYKNAMGGEANDILSMFKPVVVERFD
jgi:hypothetical protein